MGLSTFDVFKQVDSEGLIEVTGEKLCALQGVLLQMLRDVDSVCSRHGIPYTLGGGSCLGAARHQGFIPWDDDLDINMTREGYRRFAEAYGAELQKSTGCTIASAPLVTTLPSRGFALRALR